MFQIKNILKIINYVLQYNLIIHYLKLDGIKFILKLMNNVTLILNFLLPDI